MRISNSLSVIIVLTGIYSWISPYALGINNYFVVDYNAALTGLAIMWLGIFGIIANTKGVERKVNAVAILVGVWVLLSPFVLGFAGGANPPSAMLNAFIIGSLVILIELAMAINARTPLPFTKDAIAPVSEATIPAEKASLPVQ